MTTTAQSVIRRVAETLQDLAAVQWATNELVRYLNDGQREIVIARPDATSTTAAIAMVAGAKQSLPATAIKLLDIIRNTAGTKKAIRPTSRAMLDALSPDWQSMTGVTDILHFTYDPRDVDVFYVYPPAAASGASVEAVYSVYPTDVTEPADATTYTSVSGNIGVADIYANALRDYILYRAYSKNSESAGHAQLAVAYYGSFSTAIGLEAKATAAVAPA